MPDMTTESGTQINIRVLECEHTLMINNLSFCNKKHGECIDSLPFSADCSSIRWMLKFYPHGHTEAETDYVSLFLHLLNDNITVNARIKFSTNIAGHNEPRLLSYIFEEKTGYGYKKFMERRNLMSEEKKLLPNDTLIIRCELSYAEEKISTLSLAEMPKVPSAKRQLCDDLEDMLNDHPLSDVTLVASNKELMAHKAILAARSSVFRAMFQHDMLERKENRVEVTDVDFETLEQMLRYIYTDKVPDLKDCAESLLSASNKYDLEGLNLLCQQELCDNLQIETATEMLILADMHGAQYLKAQAVKFINDHEAELMQKGNLKSLYNSHPQLIMEVARQRLAINDVRLSVDKN